MADRRHGQGGQSLMQKLAISPEGDFQINPLGLKRFTSEMFMFDRSLILKTLIKFDIKNVFNGQRRLDPFSDTFPTLATLYHFPANVPTNRREV
jgi:hypothetical protein